MKRRLLTATASMVVGIWLAATAVAQAGAKGPETEVSGKSQPPAPAITFAALPPADQPGCDAGEGKPDSSFVTVTIDRQSPGEVVIRTVDGITLKSEIRAVPLSEAFGGVFAAGGAQTSSTRCWEHKVTAYPDMGEYYSKTTWCANTSNGTLTKVSVSGRVTKANWPWVRQSDSVDTTAGGVGKTYHEDTGRAKFQYCPPLIDCSPGYDIVKIWKHQYGDGTADSETTYEWESL